ncbi:Scr1 family TA system antitoxin-like transcriptional regulator [Streptomyces sp. NPDC059991]|uniref:Scr1 family TA system antitoxin-like transcriptional regulator n=1 Tax=Streptomyces sp. NPDC059991 TaxID=3347028 RepID=UPI003684ADC1
MRSRTTVPLPGIKAATPARTRLIFTSGPEVMAGQLGYLLSAAALPSVSIGIIPQDADRSGVWPVEGFFLHDDHTVNVELASAHLTITQKHELALYAAAFSDQSLAAHRQQKPFAKARGFLRCPYMFPALGEHAWKPALRE